MGQHFGVALSKTSPAQSSCEEPLYILEPGHQADPTKNGGVSWQTPLWHGLNDYENL